MADGDEPIDAQRGEVCSEISAARPQTIGR
jgi:hypothetical protein